MNAHRNSIVYLIALLVLISLMSPALAREVSIPDPELNEAIRQTLQKLSGPLTEQDLLSLTNLNACCRDVSRVEGLEAASNLTTLLLGHNRLTNFTLPSGLTNLALLDLSFNSLTNVSLPSGLTSLTRLTLGGNLLSTLALPEGLTALQKLDLDGNQLSGITLPADLTTLMSLNLGENQLTRLDLPAGMTNLVGLSLFSNQLTNVSLPPDLRNLIQLDLGNNQFTNLTLPAGLTNLLVLILQMNHLTSLTLAPDMVGLRELFLSGNPIEALVLSEPMATNLVDALAQVRSQNASVFIYPLAVHLTSTRLGVGAFEFTLSGPPDIYALFGTTDLTTWSGVGLVTNTFGSAVFTDLSTEAWARKFYRANKQIQQ